MHKEALMGPGLSLEPPWLTIWRHGARFTVSSEGPAGAPRKLLNWEMGGRGHGIEPCVVSAGVLSQKACTRGITSFTKTHQTCVCGGANQYQQVLIHHGKSGLEGVLL